MFTIDGLTWPYPIDVTRKADVTASDISGLMLDGSYFNDVIGTYMSYTVKLVVPPDALDEYAALYEQLTAPVDGHAVALPYNGSTIQLTARLSGPVSDVYLRMPNGGLHWKGIQFDLTANHPSKAVTLGEVVTRGRTPLPDVSSPAIGDTYTYTASGWQRVPSGEETGY